MKIVRYGPPGEERPGVVDATGVLRDVSAHVKDWTGPALSVQLIERLARSDLTEFPAVSDQPRLGCPIAAPSKIVCIGLNYLDHAVEAGFELPQEPVIFFKSPSALCGPTDPVNLPATATAVDWEVELAVVVGAVIKSCHAKDAKALIAGFAVGNDITDRAWQFDRGGQWSKGKCADTFAPIGPWLVTPDELPASLDMRIWLQKNGESKQESRTSKLIFSVGQIIAHVSEFMTLLPGDVIMTGTPSGVAYRKKDNEYLKAGDVLTCGIEGLGIQRCAVMQASTPDDQ